ncbi:MAG: ribonucleoprotein [Thermoprotei archaeon]|nr:ribonucleoprotein [Thermoprotei archaeon]
MKPIDSPLKYLRSAINNTVLVRLKDGSEYIGRLEQCDNTMNLLLSDCVEVKEGSSEPIAKYGRVLVRGSNILFINTDYQP